MIKKLLLGLSVIAFACAGAAFAQQGGIKRTPLQKAEFPDGYVSISGIAEIPARRHCAGATPILGSNSATSWRAKASCSSRDKPPRHLIKVGDSWQIPAGTLPMTPRLPATSP